MQKRDAVTESGKNFGVLFNQDHCHLVVAPQMSNCLYHLSLPDRVEVTRWLIENQHLGTQGKKGRDGHPLLLSTGELGRMSVGRSLPEMF